MQKGGKREGPIEAYRKFWNLNPFAKNTREVFRTPTRKKFFNFNKIEPETIIERDVLPATNPELTSVANDIGNE